MQDSRRAFPLPSGFIAVNDIQSTIRPAFGLELRIAEFPVRVAVDQDELCIRMARLKRPLPQRQLLILIRIKPKKVFLGAGLARNRISDAASLASPPCLVRADEAALLRRSAAPSADICRFPEFFSVKPNSQCLQSRDRCQCRGRHDAKFARTEHPILINILCSMP